MYFEFYHFYKGCLLSSKIKQNSHENKKAKEQNLFDSEKKGFYYLLSIGLGY